MPDLPLIVWLILAGIACLLVTVVLAVLAARVRNETQRHDLAVAAHQRHLQGRQTTQASG